MTTPPAIVLGAGGHALVLLAALRRLNVAVAGVVARDIPTRDLGVPLLGDDDWLLARDPASAVLVNAIGSVGSTALRRRVADRFRAAGFRFLTVIDPEARVEADCAAGEGAQVLKGALVQPGTVIGADAIINTGAIIDHECRIGDGVHVAPGCVLSGEVIVEAGAHLGTGTVVRQGIRIGAGAVTGVGSVVVSDIAAGVVACGVPAKVMVR